MSKNEHRVSVSDGKYTFVVPADDYRVSILRHGEPWHGPQSEASNALHSIMCELDAARLVIREMRALAKDWHAGAQGSFALMRIDDALDKHARLVDDRELPSSWTGIDPPEGRSAQTMSKTDTNPTAEKTVATARRYLDNANKAGRMAAGCLLMAERIAKVRVALIAMHNEVTSDLGSGAEWVLQFCRDMIAMLSDDVVDAKVII